MNSRINPHWIVVDIEPSIALARAECLDTFRKLPATNPHAYDAMSDAPTARSMYQHDLLRQLVNYLVAFARSARHPGLNYPADLQPSASLASPRGV